MKCVYTVAMEYFFFKVDAIHNFFFYEIWTGFATLSLIVFLGVYLIFFLILSRFSHIICRKTSTYFQRVKKIYVHALFVIFLVFKCFSWYIFFKMYEFESNPNILSLIGSVTNSICHHHWSFNYIIFFISDTIWMILFSEGQRRDSLNSDTPNSKSVQL